MKCPFCSTPDTKVIDSRLNQTGETTRRRRECVKCIARFTTYEHVELDLPLIIKKDDRREPFVRIKLIDGLRKACQKRPVSLQKIEEAVQKIERQLQAYGLKEVPSKVLGQMVMTELIKIDKVAYVRFASVYREFRDVEEFVAELRDPLVPQESTDPASELVFPFAEKIL